MAGEHTGAQCSSFTDDRELNAPRSEFKLECDRENCWGTTPRTIGVGRARESKKDKQRVRQRGTVVGETRRQEGPGEFRSGDARRFCALLPQ